MLTTRNRPATESTTTPRTILESWNRKIRTKRS